MKNDEVIFLILTLLFGSLFAYGSYKVYRWFNWNFAYKDQVQMEIRSFVKEECLK